MMHLLLFTLLSFTLITFLAATPVGQSTNTTTKPRPKIVWTKEEAEIMMKRPELWNVDFLVYMGTVKQSEEEQFRKDYAHQVPRVLQKAFDKQGWGIFDSTKSPLIMNVTESTPTKVEEATQSPLMDSNNSKVIDREPKEGLFMVMLPILAVFVTLVSIFSISIYRKRFRHVMEIYSNREMNGSMFSLEEFTSRTFELRAEEIKVQSTAFIGTGRFSNVFLAKFNDNDPVAVKRGKDKSFNVQSSLQIEVETLKKLGKHPHIIDFIGSFEDNEFGLQLVFNLCPNGCLLDYLKNQPFRSVGESFSYANIEEQLFEPSCLGSGDLCRFSHQILDAMVYLSSKNIIHCDLAARNVLVLNRKHVKLSDFGLSVSIEENDPNQAVSQLNQTLIPVPWMPPEVLKPATIRMVTKKTDVWSFGVLLWEIFSLASPPYADIINKDHIYEFLEAGRRLDTPQNMTNSLCGKVWSEIMQNTWKFEPQDRPDFDQIKTRLSIQQCFKHH